MTTGERIRALRKARGLSAEDVANALGVSPSTIYRYENGDIEKVPGDTLIPIANALRTTPQYLMGWEPDPDEMKYLLSTYADYAKHGCTSAEEAMYTSFGSEREKLGIHIVGDKTAVLFYKAYESKETAGLVMDIINDVRGLSRDELLVIAGMLRGFVNRNDLLEG